MLKNKLSSVTFKLSKKKNDWTSKICLQQIKKGTYKQLNIYFILTPVKEKEM